MYIEPSQLKRLHLLLNATGKLGRKHAYVYDFSGGRTESSREMFPSEAKKLIDHLELMDRAENGVNEEKDKADRQRKKIIAIARKMGWEIGTYPDRKADMIRINKWCQEKGFGKKTLNSYSLKELPKLVYQFDQVYQSYLKSL
ncbi:hypothetical protein D3C78_1404200 [compost metagenome]